MSEGFGGEGSQSQPGEERIAREREATHRRVLDEAGVLGYLHNKLKIREQFRGLVIPDEDAASAKHIPEAQQQVLDAFWDRMVFPQDPDASKDYLGDLSEMDLSMLEEGLKGTDLIYGRIGALPEPAFNELKERYREMVELIARKDQYVAESLADVLRPDTPSRIQKSPRRRMTQKARRFVAAGVTAALLGGGGLGLSQSGVLEDSASPSGSYELLVTNPEVVQQSFADFQTLLEGPLAPAAKDKLKAQLATVLPSELNQHFAVEAIISEGKRIGTEYRLNFEGDLDQGRASDISVIRMQAEGDAVRTSIDASIDAAGNFVPAGGGENLMTSGARRLAAERAFAIVGNKWNDNKSDDIYDSGGYVPPEGSYLYPTLISINSYGDVSYTKWSKEDPMFDRYDLPVPLTDAERALQAIHLADQAQNRVINTVTEDTVDEARTLLQMAARVQKEITDN